MNRFDIIAKNWDAKERRLRMARNTFNAIAKKTTISKEANILDIGAGTGLLLLHFIENVKHITGIDYSQGMLDILQEKLVQSEINNVALTHFDANKDKLENNKFNLAISNMTFHHFKKPDEFIQQVYGSLKQGGTICIADLETEDGTFHNPDASEDVFHLGFDKNKFKTWLNNANFKNTSIETIFEIDKDGKKFPVFLAYGEKT